MKTVITIEQYDDRQYLITVEDDYTKVEYGTTHPQQTILKILKDSSIKGKRGPVKGVKRVNKVAEVEEQQSPVAVTA